MGSRSAGVSSLQNLAAAAGDLGGAITGDVETAEQFEQYGSAFGTATGLVTFGLTGNLDKAATAGNIEGVAMLGLGAGGIRPTLELPDILKVPRTGLPEVPLSIKAYDALDAVQGMYPKLDSKRDCNCN